MKKVLILLLLLPALFACKKTGKDCEQEVNGIVRDYTGKLDGCKMMIELSNGKRLEVHSQPAGTVLIDGKQVAVKYKIAENAFSICMAGDIADIVSIRYL
jgi:hypothetical protein